MSHGQSFVGVDEERVVLIVGSFIKSGGSIIC